MFFAGKWNSSYLAVWRKLQRCSKEPSPAVSTCADHPTEPQFWLPLDTVSRRVRVAEARDAKFRRSWITLSNRIVPWVKHVIASCDEMRYGAFRCRGETTLFIRWSEQGPEESDRARFAYTIHPFFIRDIDGRCWVTISKPSFDLFDHLIYTSPSHLTNAPAEAQRCKQGKFDTSTFEYSSPEWIEYIESNSSPGDGEGADVKVLYKGTKRRRFAKRKRNNKFAKLVV